MTTVSQLQQWQKDTLREVQKIQKSLLRVQQVIPPS